jgi:hypothetical protein
VVKALHVIRSELDAVLHADFQGRKVRFIGDCLHGILVEGTAQATDAEATISAATLAAGAMRSSFKLCLEKLKAADVDVTGLDLAIGFDYGKIVVTRLGMKGDLIRCATSLAVMSSEAEQQVCDANQTGLGQAAFDEATQDVRDLFGTSRKRGGLTYEVVEAQLNHAGDKTAGAARQASRAASGSAAYGTVGGASLRAFAWIGRDGR